MWATMTLLLRTLVISALAVAAATVDTATARAASGPRTALQTITAAQLAGLKMQTSFEASSWTEPAACSPAGPAQTFWGEHQRAATTALAPSRGGWHAAPDQSGTAGAVNLAAGGLAHASLWAWIVNPASGQRARLQINIYERGMYPDPCRNPSALGKAHPAVAHTFDAGSTRPVAHVCSTLRVDWDGRRGFTLTAELTGVERGPYGCPTTAAPPSPNCAPFILIESRGSGETATLSAPGAALHRELKKTLPGSVAVVPNPYPAVSVLDKHLSSILNGTGAVTKIPNLGAYHASVVKGKEWLRAAVGRLSTNCPTSRLVLAGYSQGAQVTGDIYSEPATPKGRILGVVLFGDPKFNPADTSAQKTGFSKRRSGLLSKRRAFNDRRVLSYCHDGDPICQGPGQPLMPSQHRNYHAAGGPRAAAAALGRFARLSG